MIKLKEKIGYGLGDMASSIFWKLFVAYLMIFYTDIFGISAAAVGTMFFITRMWDSFFDPIVGIVADRTNTRWGKFRPYLLWLSLPFAIIGILTFYTPDVGYQGKIIYAYITYSLMMMVYSAINVPYASLLGVMSDKPKERNTLSSYRMTFAYIGSFFVLLFFIPLVKAFSRNNDSIIVQQQSWTLAIAVMAIICVILFIGCFFMTKEVVKPIEDKAHSLKNDIIDLFHNHPWWILLGAGIGTLVFNSMRDGATVYYFKYYINEESFTSTSFLGISFVLSGLYLSIGQIANIVGVMIAAPLSNSIGKKKTFISAMFIASILSIIFYWFDKNDLIWIFIFQILISICAGSIFPLLWSMYADSADYSELKTGNRATGLIFSASSMSQKFGCAIGTAITGWLLAYFGFKANVIQQQESINGIRMFQSFLPAAGAIISFIFMMFYPLSEKRMTIITKELKERRKE